MNRHGLDEMQIRIKERIGNQTFVMLLALLLLDVALHGYGIRWVSYPANVMILLTLICGIYVVRLIGGNAFVGPGEKRQKPLTTVALTVLTALVVAASLNILGIRGGSSDHMRLDSASGLILCIVPLGALLAALTALVVRRVQDRD